MSKKIISIILSLILALSVFPVGAEEADFAAFNDLRFFKALSLVDEGVTGKTQLTRYDLASLYYRIITSAKEIYPAEYPSDTFIDVDEDIASPITFVSKMGLMNGIGGGLFDPDGKVMYAQLIKTVVSFLGYDEAAKAKGGYPAGYYRIASDLDIELDDESLRDTYVTYAMAEEILLDAAGADLAVMLNGQLTILGGTTYLSQYRKIHQGSGLVTADNFTDVDNNKPQYYGIVRINSVDFNVLEGARGIIEEGGRRVNFMYTDDGKYPELVYYETIEAKEIKISAPDVINVTGSEIIYEENGRERRLKYNIRTEIMYNGSSISSNYTASDINPFDTKDGSLLCLDNNEDGILDSIYISAYELMVVGTVADEAAYPDISISSGAGIEFDKLNEGTLVNAEGTPIDWTIIKKGDVLCYERDRHGNFTKVTLVIDQGSGVISEIETDGLGNIEKLSIGESVYTLAKSARLSPDIGRLKPGQKITYYFGIDKTIAAVELMPSDSKIAVAVDFDKGSSLFNNIRLKIFTDKPGFEIYNIAKKVRVTTAAYGDVGGITPEKLIEDYLGLSDGRLIRQLIKYELNNAGEISQVIFPDTDGFYHMTGFDQTTYKDTLYTFAFNAFVGPSTVVYEIPSEADRGQDDLYRIDGVNAIDRLSSSRGDVLNAYTSEQISPFIEHALIQKGSSSSANLSQGTTVYNYFIVTKVSRGINDDGTACTKITGYGRNNSTKHIMQELILENDSLKKINGEDIEVGDIIKLGSNANGEVNKAEFIINMSEALSTTGKVYGAHTGVYPDYYVTRNIYKYPYATLRYTYGKAQYKIGDYVMVDVPRDVASSGPAIRESYPLSRFNVVLEYNKRTKKFTELPFDKAMVRDAATYGEDKASEIFAFTAGEYWIAGIVINKD